jgi:dimethylargininase
MHDGRVQKRALVRRPGPRLDDGLITHIRRTPIDQAKAHRQWLAYAAAFQAEGWELYEVDPADDCPDAVFVEDTAVIVDECAVLARPGIDSRGPEVDAIAPAVDAVRPTFRIGAPGTLEGGDVLRVGRTFFVGQTPRTNAEGTRQLAAFMEPHGYDVVPATPRGCLHLKSAVTYIGDGTVLVNPEWIDVDLFSRWQCVPVPAEEPFGANALLAGEIVHVSASAPLTRRKLDALGFATRALDTSEFEKAEAALTCLSLIFA